MRPQSICITAALTVWLLGGLAAHSQVPGKMTPKDLSRIDAALAHDITFKGVAGKMVPLDKYLDILEKALPADKRVALKIDKTAFKKHLKDMPSYKIKMPAEGDPIPLARALDLLIDTLTLMTDTGDPKIVVDAGPGYIQITKAGREPFWRVTHDIKDIVARADGWKSVVKFGSLPSIKNLPPADLIAQLVVLEVEPKHWAEAKANDAGVTILNDSKLVVTTNWEHQTQVADVLDNLRHWDDVAVQMQAELYEVDPAFYAKKIAPLLKHEGGPPKTAAIVESDLVAALTKQKLVLEGDELQIPDRKSAVVLSYKKTYSHVGLGEPTVSLSSKALFAVAKKGFTVSVLVEPTAKSPFADKVVSQSVKTVLVKRFGKQKDQPEPEFQTVVLGVSFTARVDIAADQASFKLKLSQQSADMVGSKWSKLLNPENGDTKAVELPTVHRTLLTADLDLQEGEAVVMPSAYQTPDAKAKGRILVLLLRPVILTDEVKDQIKESNEAHLNANRELKKLMRQLHNGPAD